MTTVGERIKARRKELKLSADYVADKLGKNRATVYRYEGDEIEDMSINVVREIAKVLRVDPLYLMGMKQDQEDTNITSNYPYLSEPISAGLPNTVDGVTETETETISIPDLIMGKHAGKRDIYITRTNGDSMNNVIPHNSLIAVKPVDLSELRNGDIVVYKHNQEYAVKRFYQHGKQLIFKPDSNKEHYTDNVINIEESTDINIKGKVVLYIVEQD